MTQFIEFKKSVQTQFKKMSENQLFTTSCNKDLLWETYLKSFPEGTNPIFRERTEHDCSCCKNFIRNLGNVVSINNGIISSIWDIEGEIDEYNIVAKEMSKFVKKHPIAAPYFYYEKTVGVDSNIESIEFGKTIKWEHFFSKLPKNVVIRKTLIGEKISDFNSGIGLFKRGLKEITVEALETVIELISQNSIYRGEEHKNSVENFLDIKNKYDKIKTNKKRDLFCWENFNFIPPNISRIKNTVIGTLLTDLSKGVDLNIAVTSFESKVAPTNYKRPTALITKSMINNAQKKVEELGIADSLKRRYAVTEDLTINNVIYADRSVKKQMNVFEELVEESEKTIQNLNKIEEVDINKFLNDIVPKAKKIELFFENSKINNLISLVAPIEKDSKNIFKWNNNFSWSYNGEFADSIKEKVKKAGGKVDGVLRFSLSWFNYDDLDLHVVEPNKNHIYFSNKYSVTSGELDVDMNVRSSESRNAVENIVWTNKEEMLDGDYLIYVNNYAKRENIDLGFIVEMEYNGKISQYHYKKSVVGRVDVLKIKFSKKDGIKIIEQYIKDNETSQEIWNIETQKFHKIKMIMNSPNHWDGECTGNLHHFFILDDCKNNKETRGFYNEFLSNDLNKHRKVFEVLGSKMKVEKSDSQLSGLGFSSTRKDEAIFRVSGKFTRTIKVKF